MRWQAKVAIMVSLIVSTAASYAMLQLELTQGIVSAIPIAITSFSGASAPMSGDTRLSQIIANDLQHSGEFSVTGPQGISLPSVQQGLKIDYQYWRKQKVDNVLSGHVEQLPNGRYQISVKLVSLYDKSHQQTSNDNGVLFNETFAAPQQALRSLAHHISDLVYQKITGVPGVFSTKIAYILVQRSANKVVQYSLEVADADGFNPRALLVSSQPIMSPAWSPDGSKIAYVSFENHRAAIYLQDLATGDRWRVSDAPGINGAPVFTPDGKQLALVLTKTGNPKIYLLDLATRQLHGLTHGYAIDTEPAFSKDGKQMLFTSNRGGSPQVYVYALATGKITRVSYRGNYNARASFLPDAQSIVMMHREAGLFGIAREDLSEGQVQVLVQTGADESPSVAPNGKMVLYATQYAGRGVLAQVSIDGRIKLVLPAREGSVQEPAWSPFLTGENK